MDVTPSIKQLKLFINVMKITHSNDVVIKNLDVFFCLKLSELRFKCFVT